MKRSSGVLLPIFSLPSCGCIGTLGKAAYQFVDFLAAAGQHWWQMLPVGPTGYGNSPYQSFSSYAGNPYFIDLEQLVAEDALPLAALKQLCVAAAPSVDYARLYAQQHSVLALSMDLSWDRFSDEIAQFTQDNQDWLPDYALFMALKQHFAMKPWYEWEDISIRRREKAALAHYRQLLGREIQLYTYMQFLFFRQFHALHAYAQAKGLG